MAEFSKGKGAKSGRFGGNRRTGKIRTEVMQIWGIHACQAAILNPKRKVRKISSQGPAPDWLTDVLTDADGLGVERPTVTELDRREFLALLPEQAVHQGAVLSIDPIATPSLDQLIEQSRTNTPALFVVLDQVVDPHNVGAIVRSAAVFGAMAVIVQDRHSPPMSGTLFKAACGGCEHVPIVSVANIARTIKRLSDAAITTLGLAEAGNRTLGQFEPTESCAIVLGAEGAGLRRLVSETCDQLVSLPTFGPISTLNVSNAAAVALFHISGRQRFGNS